MDGRASRCADVGGAGRAARRLVEQQSEQRARRVPQQQPSNESQQQYRLSGGASHSSVPFQRRQRIVVASPTGLSTENGFQKCRTTSGHGAAAFPCRGGKSEKAQMNPARTHTPTKTHGSPVWRTPCSWGAASGLYAGPRATTSVARGPLLSQGMAPHIGKLTRPSTNHPEGVQSRQPWH